MADLASLQYGKVVSRFTAIVADSADAGDNPDALPMSGSLTFTPLVSGPIRVPGATPPQIVIPMPIQAVLDAEGDIIQAPGVEGVMLMASDGPTEPTDVCYRVSFFFQINGQDVSIPSFDIAVPAGGVVDLALIMPVAPGTGGGTPVEYVLPTQVVVGGTIEPDIVGQGIWFKEIAPGVFELWLDKG